MSLARWYSAADEVWPRIFVSPYAFAQDHALLRQHGITHVLNVSGRPSIPRFDAPCEVKWIAANDDPAFDMAAVFRDGVAWVRGALQASEGAKVLVHCEAGASRSVSVVIAYLVVHEGLGLDGALRAVRSKRAAAMPNVGFMQQLARLEEAATGRPCEFDFEAYVIETALPFIAAFGSEAPPPREVLRKVCASCGGRWQEFFDVATSCSADKLFALAEAYDADLAASAQGIPESAASPLGAAVSTRS